MYKEHKYYTSYSDVHKTDHEITPSKGVIIKVKIHPKTDKDKFFTDLIKWFDSYEPNQAQDRLTFKLQGATFNIINNKSIIIKWFKRLHKLSLEHFTGWDIKKFIV